LAILRAEFHRGMMQQQHTMQSSSTRLQTRSNPRSLIRIHATFSPNHITSHNNQSLVDRTAPSALAAQTAAASRLQQQQRRQQQQQRSLVAAAATAKKQAARAPAGKGFGNPNKLASKTTSNATRKCPCGSGQLYPVSPRQTTLLFHFVHFVHSFWLLNKQ
jgi:hypothetical protein